ncbi:MAG TPA: heparin lyase I family protein [Polyangiaceae bacterium]|nr:heparin lyase I family protein [Polyangiaceae bacterium]
MKYVASLSVLLLVATVSEPAHAAVIWTGDFESGDLSQWDGVTNETKGDRVNIEIVEDIVTQGTKACRFEIHGDDDFSNTQSRTQVTRRSERTGEGQDVYMAKYVLMPADAKVRNQIQYWESDGYKNNVDFWVEPKEGGGTTINFGTGLLGADVHWTADLTLNQWHLVAHHIHWSQDASQGSISVWYDGVLVVDAIKLATKPDNQSLFTQLGFHRAERDDLVDVIYIDGVIEADSEVDITSLPVPTMASGGSGGAGGGGGLGGTAGGGAAGTGGTDAGSGGMPAGGSSAGVPTAGGTGGAGLAGSGGSVVAPTPPVAAATSDDGGGCSLRSPRGSNTGFAALLFGAVLLARRLQRRR